MLDSGTLSPLLKRMVSAGLVTKQRSTADERSVLVQLTAEGRALRERASGVPAKVAGATGLAPAQLRTLRTTLREMAGAAQATAAALPQ